jgi:hypothetical protein
MGLYHLRSCDLKRVSCTPIDEQEVNVGYEPVEMVLYTELSLRY